MQVYLTEKIHDDAVAFLGEHFDVAHGYLLSDAEKAEAQANSQGILVRSAKVTPELMDAMPQLRVIAKHGIGVDNIDVEEATKRGIQVVNAPFANINAVAEHTVALLLAASKNMVLLDRSVREGRFADRNRYLNTELAGKTVGLLGFGKIARLVAKKLAAFDMVLLANDPYCDPSVAAEYNTKLVSREELVEKSDFLSLHTPLLPETRGMVNEAFLAKMKPTAVLLNASRGGVIDEAALVQALRSGVIAGAGLDVFDPEPPLADNPLFAMDQVVLSPHNAALTDSAMRAMSMDSATGICDYLEGRVPQYPVNRI